MCQLRDYRAYHQRTRTTSARKSRGLGNTYFNELLREHARLPMDEQATGLERALAEYRGDYDQRDDVTVLAFRVI